MWQEGRLVYGVVVGFDYLAAFGGGATLGPGGLAYSHDFAGTPQVQVGSLITPDVLLHAKAGVLVVGAASFSLPFTREDIAVRPDARVGVEWAVTGRLSGAGEAGVLGNGLH